MSNLTKQKEQTTKREILRVDNVTRTYGTGRTQLKALNGATLSIVEGEFISVMGPSGSGKTTLLNVMGALDRPTEGQVIIDGIDTSIIPEHKLFTVRRNHVGFIFQSFYLIPTLTALENVLTPVLPIRGNKEYTKRAKKLLEQVGLAKRIDHKPAELSGGEQQRVAIARSLILNPPIILADEPTGNLDTKTGTEVFSILRELNEKENVTFVIVTHDPRIAKATERTIYLQDGKVSDTPSVDMEELYSF